MRSMLDWVPIGANLITDGNFEARAQLAANPSFDDTSVWDVIGQSNGCYLANHQAVFAGTGTGIYCRQTLTGLDAGGWSYAICFYIKNYVSGSVMVRLGANNSASFTGNGFHWAFLACPTSTVTFSIETTSAGFNQFAVDNVHVFKDQPHSVVDFGNPPYSYRDVERVHSGTYSWKVTTDAGAKGIYYPFNSKVGHYYRAKGYLYAPSALNMMIGVFTQSGWHSWVNVMYLAFPGGVWTPFDTGIIQDTYGLSGQLMTNTDTTSGTFWVDDLSVYEYVSPAGVVYDMLPDPTIGDYAPKILDPKLTFKSDGGYSHQRNQLPSQCYRIPWSNDRLTTPQRTFLVEWLKYIKSKTFWYVLPTSRLPQADGVIYPQGLLCRVVDAEIPDEPTANGLWKMSITMESIGPVQGGYGT